MTLGEVMQAASAFTIVQAAFNWLVDNYPRLSDWIASSRAYLDDGVTRCLGAGGGWRRRPRRIERGETERRGAAAARPVGHAR
jgi:putative ATP-binding cassette transporter